MRQAILHDRQAMLLLTAQLALWPMMVPGSSARWVRGNDSDGCRPVSSGRAIHVKVAKTRHN